VFGSILDRDQEQVGDIDVAVSLELPDSGFTLVGGVIGDVPLQIHWAVRRGRDTRPTDSDSLSLCRGDGW
jgi:hypothetical protein